MKTATIGLLAILLLSGCSSANTEPAESEPIVGDSSPAAVTDSADPSQDQSAPDSNDASDGHDRTEAASKETASLVDAEQLLASTLACARADNKRVMVHLGAPW